MVTLAPADAHALIEALATVDAGPLTSRQVAVAISREEPEVERLLDQQRRVGRVKTSEAPAYHELTDQGRADLAFERLIYAVVAELMLGRARNLAAIDDDAAHDLGLLPSSLSVAGAAAFTEGWIASSPLDRNDDVVTEAGRRAWSAAEAMRPLMMAPLLAKYRQ